MSLKFANAQRANPQRGALFGLDARIALAVFSLLAVITGAAMVLNLNESRAKGLASELVDSAKAIESFHHDVQADIFDVLSEPSEARAFQALYDPLVITEADSRRGRWNGPYIRASSNLSPAYGVMSLQKRGPDHTKPCDAESLCFLWLVYDEVKPEIVRELNEIIDGAGDGVPETSGRVQWSQNQDRALMLYFRAVKALTWTQADL